MKNPPRWDQGPASFSLPAFISITCAAAQLALIAIAMATAGPNGDVFKFSFLAGICFGFLAGTLGFLNGLLWMPENFLYGAGAAVMNVLLFLLRFVV